MNKSRFGILIIVPTLILVTLVGLQSFRPAYGESEIIRKNIGMGDVHRYEVRAAIPDSGSNESTYAGMGDVHLLESQPFFLGTYDRTGFQPGLGMGDLHLFEALQRPQNLSGQGF